jgi:hypothetical protein
MFDVCDSDQKRVGPSKIMQAAVNKQKFVPKTSKTALSDLVLIPKWAF